MINDFFFKIYGKFFLKFAYERVNLKIKKQLVKILKKNQIYICGHSHVAEIDFKNQFINSGNFRSGLAQYLLIEEEKISLKEERY